MPREKSSSQRSDRSSPRRRDDGGGQHSDMTNMVVVIVGLLAVVVGAMVLVFVWPEVLAVWFGGAFVVTFGLAIRKIWRLEAMVVVMRRYLEQE